MSALIINANALNIPLADKSIENNNPDYYKQELASRDALIERLIEAGNVLVDQNDMDNGAVMAAEDEWRFLVTEWKAMKGGE